MALPITVPFTFGNATTTQSLSSLDVDFSTVYNAVNGIGNGTVSLANVSITGGTISANLSASGIFSGTSNVSITSANGPVSIATNGNNAVYVDTSGNVGIGTSSPTSKLTIAGNTSIQDGAGYGWGALTAYVGGSSASNFVNVLTNSTERMRIDSSGNLLVGTTSVNPGIGNNNTGCMFSSGGFGSVSRGDTAWYVNYTGTGTGQNVRLLWQGTTVGNISTTSTATAYNTSSDYRLKENVQPLTTGLATIGALKPVSHDWISDKSKGEGFIAHELQAVIPLAVTGEKDAVDAEGKPIHQGVDYSKIVVHLVAAIQELSAKNDALEARLVALESK
jgi:hypothetical protein